MIHYDLPEHEREIVVETEAVLRTADISTQLDIPHEVSDLVSRGKIVLSPGVTTFALNGLHHIASSHGFWGALKNTANQTRLAFGAYPEDKPAPPPRHVRTIRKAARAATRKLQ